MIAIGTSGILAIPLVEEEAPLLCDRLGKAARLAPQGLARAGASRWRLYV